MKKELWLQVESNEMLFEKEAEIYDILSLEEGNVQVVIYAKNTKAIKRLPSNRDTSCSDVIIQALENLLGADNVRYIESETRRDYYDSQYRDLFEELDYIKGSGPTGLAMMKINRLDRIADALEGINQEMACISDRLSDMSNSAEALEKLADCVNNYQLCITGDVTI